MGHKIYDILEPYEDEVLFSWVVRMVRLYTPTEKLTYMGEHLKFLFGPDTTAYPGLYWQRGLDYFTENCGLENSRWFKSGKDMIDSMSILPFYFYFLDVVLKQDIYKKLSSYELYRYGNSIIGIYAYRKNLEGKMYIKFCWQCMKEQPEIYLKKEQQVPGNFMCCKHKCILHRIPYGKIWKDIDFPTSISNGRNVSSYELTDSDCEKAMNISEMIHNIFINGFQDDISVVKEKIMYRLKELQIVSEEGKFYNLEAFIEELDAGYLYQFVPIEKELISAVYVSQQKPNPIIYLVLIQYLFGSLGGYYAYEYKPGSSVSVQYKNVQKEMVEDRIHDISFYISNQPKWFSEEYVILGETKKDIIIKHLRCGNILRRSKKLRKHSKCRYCEGDPLLKNKTIENIIPEHEYIYYLSTVEYAKLHGKKFNQISNYCKANRFPGSIVVGDKYLIPIDAPYPGDMRLKINKK